MRLFSPNYATHPSSSVEVKERVELYLYSPFWVIVACSRVNFTFYYYDPMRKIFELETKDWRRQHNEDLHDQNS
jgi:hypothetical protein